MAGKAQIVTSSGAPEDSPSTPTNDLSQPGTSNADVSSVFSRYLDNADVNSLPI